MIFFLEKIHKTKKYNSKSNISSYVQKKDKSFFNVGLVLASSLFLIVMFIFFCFFLDAIGYLYLDYLVNKNCILFFDNIDYVSLDSDYDSRSDFVLIKYLFL